MMDLSVIIPARNEVFLQQTIKNVLENSEADTEIIAICDGYWPEPPVLDNPRVVIVHHTVPIGQRAATNEGARISQAKYVMKLDAHCAVDKGFDRKLIEVCQHDWTLVPLMYNLHAFDWECPECGKRVGQGVKPKICAGCNNPTDQQMKIVWQPKWDKVTYSWRFDRDMHFQYWKSHRNRPETRKGDFVETMSFIGACWFMERDRYWELEGCDEKHGSWGQLGTEWACKTWLSGGKLLTYKKTWFAHMFRTGNFNGAFETGTFPYEMSWQDQENARIYSRDLWLNDKWPKAVRPLKWITDHFQPPGWEDY